MSSVNHTLNTGKQTAKLKVNLKVWLADLTYTQQAIAADMMPMAIGCIAGYAEEVLDLQSPIRLFKYPEKLAQALAEDGIPDVIGFSCYIWNNELSCTFARRIKEVRPETVVVFGGPHYPATREQQETFLRKRSAIDFYIAKEGEQAFVNLLSALTETDMDKEAVKRRVLASVHAIGADGIPYLSGTAERIRDLGEVPSPYTSGRLDEFFDGKLSPLLQTNRGCPFTCTFCVEGSGYYNKVHRRPQKRIAAELDYIGRKMQEQRQRGGRNDLFIADSNFGMYRQDIDTCRSIAEAQDKYQWPEYINVATGKNQKERVLDAARLVRGAIRLSGSVQSLDQSVLENVKRANISPEALMQLAMDAADVQANSYCEIILALPGETKASHFQTLKTVIEAGFNRVIIWQLMMLLGSDMCTPEGKEKYKMDLRYRALPRCCGSYEILGKDLPTAEIEEICVATNTLSYEDYIECRRLHLIINIFYTDGMFGGVLKFLRALGISLYDWIVQLVNAEKKGRLKGLFEHFEIRTRDELWRNEDELYEFIRRPGIIRKYLDGELGYNLIFVHKATALSTCASELIELARDTLHPLLRQAGVANEQNLVFLEDALQYDGCRMKNIFEDGDAVVSTRLRYDVQRYFEERGNRPIADYRYSQPVTCHFVLDDSQRERIESFKKIYGDNVLGAAFMLGRVYVKKLLRHPVPQAASLHAMRESA